MTANKPKLDPGHPKGARTHCAFPHEHHVVRRFQQVF